MIERFWKFWKDPVWSKVISAGIIGLIIFVYKLLESIVKKESFKQNLKNFWEQKYELWQFAIGTFLIILGIFTFIKYKTKKKEQKNAFDNYDLTSIHITSEENNVDYDEDSKNADKEIFNEIRNNILPANNGIYWLRNQNFRGFSFNPKNMRDFDEFEEVCKNPNYTFINKDLEEQKEKLKIKIAKFTELIALNTWSTDVGLQTVPPEWEIEQPDRFSKTVKEIHTVAFEIIELYDDFIKMGKKILKI